LVLRAGFGRQEAVLDLMHSCYCGAGCDAEWYRLVDVALSKADPFLANVESICACRRSTKDRTP